MATIYVPLASVAPVPQILTYILAAFSNAVKFSKLMSNSASSMQPSGFRLLHSLNRIYIPFSFFNTCMHGAMAFSPTALSFSLGPSFRTKFPFNISLIHPPRKMLVDRVIVGLMEAPK